jgi:hypothetical protein
MRLRAASQALFASILLFSAAGINGCGNSNSLSSLIIVPAKPVVVMGGKTQLAVGAIFSDGMAVTGWTRVTWSSADPAMATVSSTGLVSGGTTTVGTVLITAADMSHPNITASVTISVVDLRSITVLPAVASIPTGTTQQFTATGLYTINSPSSWVTSTTAAWPQVDHTSSVLWSSSSTTVATISNVPGSNGLATSGSLTGTTTITATSASGTLITAGTATLTVN